MAKILIIDDDTLNSQLYANKLESEGHEAISVADGDKALKKISEKFDLILLDIMMPKISGVELLKEIKKGVNSQTPVLVHTNLLSEKIKQECLAIGAKEFLIKADYTPSSLVEKIRKYL